ncbi:MAG TPA: ASCH domain-containing protein [Micromonosporaceae bacterium]|nr:ASCH domain-containing protein [Micromonosporaceae bacterium]
MVSFRPELAAAVMTGAKTVTRRLCSANPRSPWWYERCAYQPGRSYAIQPGRGKPAVGRAVFVSVRREQLGELDDAEAQREGFPDWQTFEETWEQLNGRYDPTAEVWRVELLAIVPAVVS